jgi:tRNA uridine 5-carbamoylmethylation protein Kti12
MSLYSVAVRVFHQLTNEKTSEVIEITMEKRSDVREIITEITAIQLALGKFIESRRLKIKSHIQLS